MITALSMIAGSSMVYQYYYNEEPAFEVMLPAVGVSLTAISQYLENKGIEVIRIAGKEIEVDDIYDFGIEIILKKLMMIPGSMIENCIFELNKTSWPIKVFARGQKILLTTFANYALKKLVRFQNAE